MKTSSLNASILTNTNQFISTSDEDWSGLRQGTSIRFGEDKIYYTVAKTEKFLYIKDFQVLAGNKIVINEDTGITFLQDDSITLSYKEAQLNSFQIRSGGKNFKVGDKISLKGGVLSKDMVTGRPYVTTLTVSKVNEDTSVAELKVEERGKYTQLPEQFVFDGIELDVNFTISDNRALIERDIEKVEHENGKTYITLIYHLPDGIKDGKVSVNKWRGFLTSNYVGDSKIEEPYDAIRDFTPNFNFPLIVKNHPAPEMVYNQALMILDKELKKLQEMVEKGPFAKFNPPGDSNLFV